MKHSIKILLFGCSLSFSSYAVNIGYSFDTSKQLSEVVPIRNIQIIRVSNTVHPHQKALAEEFLYLLESGTLTVEKARYLIEVLGLDPNYQDPSYEEDRSISLMGEVAVFNRADLISLLCEKHANPNIQDNYTGDTPIMKASYSYHNVPVFDVINTLNQLKKCGANLNAGDKYKQTALINIVFRHSRRMIASLSTLHLGVTIMKWFLDNGADPDIPDDEEQTPLFTITEMGEIEYLKLLIQYNPNPHIYPMRGPNTGKPPYLLAVHKYRELESELKQKSIDIDAEASEEDKQYVINRQNWIKEQLEEYGKIVNILKEYTKNWTPKKE